MRRIVVFDPTRFLIPGSHGLRKWPLVARSLRQQLPQGHVVIEDVEWVGACWRVEVDTG
jgi:hypothetical protein